LAADSDDKRIVLDPADSTAIILNQPENTSTPMIQDIVPPWKAVNEGFA
jgi:hypothetical protein